MTVSAEATGEWLDLPDDPGEMVLEAARLGWGDGLPFIPPTAERIDAMLAGPALTPGSGCRSSSPRDRRSLQPTSR